MKNDDLISKNVTLIGGSSLNEVQDKINRSNFLRNFHFVLNLTGRSTSLIVLRILVIQELKF